MTTICATPMFENKLQTNKEWTINTNINTNTSKTTCTRPLNSFWAVKRGEEKSRQCVGHFSRTSVRPALSFADLPSRLLQSICRQTGHLNNELKYVPMAIAELSGYPWRWNQCKCTTMCATNANSKSFSLHQAWDWLQLWSMPQQKKARLRPPSLSWSLGRKIRNCATTNAANWHP